MPHMRTPTQKAQMWLVNTKSGVPNLSVEEVEYRDFAYEPNKQNFNIVVDKNDSPETHYIRIVARFNNPLRLFGA